MSGCGYQSGKFGWRLSDRKMGRLEYDTGAFSFFLVALWLAALLPFTFSGLRALRRAEAPQNADVKIPPTYATYGSSFVERICRNKQERAKNERAEARAGAMRRLSIAAVCWAIAVAYLMSRPSGADIQKFDPFEILGISQSASELEIKKAYKKLSLVHHPDRWAKKEKSEQALAETRFIMVAKAYEALTDPIARDNFQKYGNPDGRQAMEMSIGLPSWLLEKENQTWVIATYLLLSLIVFPTSVMLITANASSPTGLPKRLFPDTEEIFRFAIRTEFFRQFTSAAEVFSLAAEFRSLVYRSEDERKKLLDLRNQMAREDKYPMKPSVLAVNLFKQKPQMKNSEGNEKTLVLVWVHLNRMHDLIDENLQDDLVFILSRAPLLCKAIIQHARVSCNMQVLSLALFFQQHLFQAVSPHGASLQCLPHIPTEDLEFIGREIGRKVKFAGISPEKKNRTLIQEMMLQKTKNSSITFLENAKEEKDLDEVLAILPFKELTVSLGTLKEVIIPSTTIKSKDVRNNEYIFEDESVPGDFIHAICDLDEQNLRRLERIKQREDGEALLAHCPFMPVDVREEWHVIVVGGPAPRGLQHIPAGEMKIAAFGTIDDDGQNKLRADLQFLSTNNGNDWMGSADWPVGKVPVMALAFSSCYVELQRMAKLELKLTDPKKIPKFKLHEEDERLKFEPTSLMEMLQPSAEPTVDSDFEDEATPKGNGKTEHPEDTE